MKRTLIEKLNFIMFAAILAVIVVLLAGCIGCMPDYADGERTGTVVNLSHRGLIIKSWEGSLHLGQSQITGGSDTWYFSLRGPAAEAMAQQLIEAQHAGKVVTLHYHEWAMNPVSIETQDEVDRIDASK